MHDLRRMARRRLPRGVFDYIDGGAEDEHTHGRELGGLPPHRLPPARAARRRRGRSVDHAARPAVADPAGAGTHRLHAHRRSRGRARRRARGARGRPAVHASTRSARGRSRRSPTSATAASGSRSTCCATAGWCEEMVERAAAPGYEALVLTVDTAVHGRRERDVRRGFDAAAEDRARHAARRRDPPGLDVALRARRADPLRQRRRASTWATAPTAVTLADYINAAVRPEPHRGATSTGCARSGTARSW